MVKMFTCYGRGQAEIPVLPPPLPFINPPTSNQTNYEIGQLVFSPPISPTAFFLYGGGGNWVEIATNTGAVLSVTGTANQILASPTTGNVVLSLIGPYTPATYTAHGVLIGEGTSSIVATAVGTDGQVLTGNSAADPAFAAIGTKSGLTAHGVVVAEGASAFAATAAGTTGQVLTATTSADPAFAAIGTGSGLTAHGVLLAEGSGAFVATSAGTTGQFLVSNGASADPTFQTATPQLTVTTVAGTSQAMLSGHSYIANNSSQTAFSLPATSSVGDIIQVVGSALNTGGFQITQATGQIIWGPAGHSTSGATGTATSAGAAAQSVTISCVVANTTWVITANSGTIALA